MTWKTLWILIRCFRQNIDMENTVDPDQILSPEDN